MTANNLSLILHSSYLSNLMVIHVNSEIYIHFCNFIVFKEVLQFYFGLKSFNAEDFGNICYCMLHKKIVMEKVLGYIYGQYWQKGSITLRQIHRNWNLLKGNRNGIAQ